MKKIIGLGALVIALAGSGCEQNNSDYEYVQVDGGLVKKKIIDENDRKKEETQQDAPDSSGAASDTKAVHVEWSKVADAYNREQDKPQDMVKVVNYTGNQDIDLNKYAQVHKGEKLKEMYLFRLPVDCDNPLSVRWEDRGIGVLCTTDDGDLIGYHLTTATPRYVRKTILIRTKQENEEDETGFNFVFSEEE